MSVLRVLKFQSKRGLSEQVDLELLLTILINVDERGRAYMYGFIMNENEGLRETKIKALIIYRKINQ